MCRREDPWWAEIAGAICALFLIPVGFTFLILLAFALTDKLDLFLSIK